MDHTKVKTPVISGKNIVQTFGHTKVLNEISIEIYDGDFTVIMGASGCGKSTLLYCLSGMERAAGGTMLGLIGSVLGEKDVRKRAKELAAWMNLQDAADRLPS